MEKAINKYNNWTSSCRWKYLLIEDLGWSQKISWLENDLKMGLYWISSKWSNKICRWRRTSSLMLLSMELPRRVRCIQKEHSSWERARSEEWGPGSLTEYFIRKRVNEGYRRGLKTLTGNHLLRRSTTERSTIILFVSAIESCKDLSSCRVTKRGIFGTWYSWYLRWLNASFIHIILLRAFLRILRTPCTIFY